VNKEIRLSEKLLLSYDEAVSVLGISRRTLQDLVNDGDIKVSARGR